MSNLLFDLFDYDSIIKECKKKYDLKKKDVRLYVVRNDMTFHFWPRLKRIDGQFLLYTGIRFKPHYADEICWALSAQSTSPYFPYEWHANHPFSYRIVGLPGPEKIIHDEWIPIDCKTTEELKVEIEKVIEQTLRIIEGVTEKDYATATEVSMINIFRSIRHNDYKTASRLTWKIKEAWFDKYYEKKGILPADRPHHQTAEDETAINAYYMWKSPLLKYIRKNKKKMKENIKAGRLFEAAE